MQRWFAHAETCARAPKDSHSHPRSSSFLHLKGAFVPKRHFCSVFTAGLLRDSNSAGWGWGGGPRPPTASPQTNSSRIPDREDGGTAGAGRWCLFFLFQHLPHQPVANGDLRRRAAPRVPPPRRRLYSTVVCVCVLGAASAHRNVPCSAFPFSARPPRRPASVGFYVRVSFRGLICQEKKERKSLFSKKNWEKKGFTPHCKSASFMYEKIKGMICIFFPQILDVVL